MNRRDMTRFVELEKETGKKETKKGFSFLELLDLIDFRDDLRYK